MIYMIYTYMIRVDLNTGEWHTCSVAGTKWTGRHLSCFSQINIHVSVDSRFFNP